MMADNRSETSTLFQNSPSLCIDVTSIFKAERSTVVPDKNVLKPVDFNPQSDSIPTSLSKKSSHNSIRNRLQQRAEEKAKKVSFETTVLDANVKRTKRSVCSQHHEERKKQNGNRSSLNQYIGDKGVKSSDYGCIHNPPMDMFIQSCEHTSYVVDGDEKIPLHQRLSAPSRNNVSGHSLPPNLPIFEETQSSKISVRTRLEERAKQKFKQLVYERENYHFDAVTTSSPQPNSSKKCHPLQVSQATTTHSPKLNVLTDNLEDVIAQVHVEPRSVSRNDTNHAASDRQCQVFSNWLNHILKPVTDLQLEYQHAVNTCSSRSGDIVQPFFGDHQEYARYNANSLFNSSEFLHIRTALATEIARGTLAIRSDRDVFADVSLRGQMLDMLLSYSPAWLRLGLETIFQEKLSMKNLLRNFYDQCHSRQSLGLLPLESQKPSIKKVLRKFISDRMLNDPDIHYKYTGGKCFIPSGKFEIDYKKELYSTALQRILNLIIFLNHAKVNNIVESYPVLFNKDSRLKSTKEILRLLSIDYLRGEGNLLKHLAGLGINSLYQQSYIDEIDFSVSNLAVDLRDGVRLVKLASVLSGDEESIIFSKLRAPANSRLQKLHNVELALSVFRDLGIPKLAGIQARHIVDGHRAKVLEMLWLIMIHFKMPSLVSPRNIAIEIVRSQGQTNDKKTGSGSRHTTLELMSKFSDGDELCQLLLDFSNEICRTYGRSVDNFSSCFTDGKVLCLIIHHFFPHILSSEQILPTRYDLSITEVNCPSLWVQALSNEQINRNHVLVCANKIGGFPVLFESSDPTTFTDERSIIIFLAYLCSEVFPTSSTNSSYSHCHNSFQCTFSSGNASDNPFVVDHDRASLERVPSTEKYNDTMVEKTICTVAQTASGSFSDEHMISATIIQRMFRSWCDRKVENSNRRDSAPGAGVDLKFNAATMIQYNIRGYLARRQVKLSLFSAVITIIQSIYRGYKARSLYGHVRHNIRLIQRAWRASKTREEDRIAQVIDSSALRIQTFYRHYKASRCFIFYRTQIVCLQSHVRRYLVMKRHRNQKMNSLAAVTMQSFYRAAIVRSKFLSFKKASVRLQIMYRRSIARLHDRVLRECAINIQKVWRGFTARLQYYYDLSDIVFVQSLVRSKLACKKVYIMKRLKLLQEELEYRKVSCCKIQRMWRGFSGRRQLRLGHYFARTIQLWFRKQKKYILQKATISVLQRRYHSYCKELKLNTAALVIQTRWRSYVRRVDFIIASMSAVRIQNTYRRYYSINRRQSIIDDKSPNACQYTQGEHTLTAIARVSINNQGSLSSSAEKIQCAVRRFLAKKKFSLIMKGITSIQGVFRGRNIRAQRSISVKNAADRIRRVHAQSNSKMTLGERTKDSLRKLTKTEGIKLTEIMQSLRTLEICTRLSRECCHEFIFHDAHSILCNFMKFCNRSLPHVQLIDICLVILMNVSQTIESYDFFAKVDIVDVMIDIVHKFRDKDSIFCNACTILYHFAHNSFSFQNLCSRPECRKILNGVYTLNMKRVNEKREDSHNLRRGLKTLGDIVSDLRNSN